MRYHWLYVLSFLTATPLADFAMPPAPWGDVRVKHAWSSVPANWEALGSPSAGTTIDLYVALNPHHDNALIDALFEVSDPNHPRYGAHLSKEQVAELVRPHPDTLELVTSWLAHHGVRPSSISTTHGGAWLTVSNVLVSQANEMLGASYQLYRHAKVNDTIIRTVSYALPDKLHAHIQAVAPTTYFVSTRTLRQTPRRRSVEAVAASGRPVTVLSSRAGEVTPSQLRWIYKTFAYVPTAADRNTLGVFGFRKDYPSETDLTRYMTNFRSDVQPPSLATFAVELVNGGEYDPDTPGMEASIDVQYASAMAYPTPIIFYSTGGNVRWSDSGEPVPGDVYLESLEYMLKKTVIPQTISISYGTYERNVPRDYASALCILFAQFGARGVSVLFSTGDNGVGKNCKDKSGNVRFVVEFPASFHQTSLVLQVPMSLPSAALQITTPRLRLPSLEAAFRTTFHARSIRTSPCPHSSSAKAPSMLASTTLRVVASLTSPPKLSNSQSSSEAFALVWRARAARLPCAFHCPIRYLGLSRLTANVQTVAGIISLLNDYLITNGRPPLGFLNIRLYHDGFAGLNDITSGSNPGCGTDGFSAVPGWDPVRPARPVSLRFRHWLTCVA
ncbi:subtilisin-like protein [Lactarius akahatsu]|uniref:Subtilisin-like protein n=1 Tax=Lactarius akahatsu TaxID=416441 RepID=A0AAD4Q4U5_9AGAM|nr:subtilisin-like protein [Lactarius akahatsu]